MSNWIPPEPELPQEIIDVFLDYGLDPADYVFNLSAADGDPDIRSGGFATIEDAIDYLTEDALLLPFSRVYYDAAKQEFIVAIPDDTE